MSSELVKPILAITVVVGATALAALLRSARRLKDVPGPSTYNVFVGHILDLEKAKTGTRFHAWARKYGLTYKLRGPAYEPYLILADPKGVQHVLSTRNAIYPRPESDRVILETMFGGGLFPAEGDEHRRMRKNLNPAFSPQAVEDVAQVFFDLADKLKNQWDDVLQSSSSGTHVVNTAKILHFLSLDAITMTTFDYNCAAANSSIPDMMEKLSAPDHDTFSILMMVLVTYIPAIMKLPNPIKTITLELRNELGKIADRVWSDTRKDGDTKLLHLFEQSEERGAAARDEAIAQIVGILFAGSETSANVMAECLHELARQPAIQDKVRAELIDFEHKVGRTPNYQDLMNPKHLPYFEAVFKETCRTKAVLMVISRAAAKEDRIPLQYPIKGTNNYEIVVEPGQLIMIPVRDGINTDPVLWGQNATEFVPERWLDEDGLPEAVRSIHAQGNMLTFGDGPKVCLGRLFAFAEMKIVLSILLRNFIFESDGSTIDFYHGAGNTVKPTIRGRESEGIKLPLKVRRVLA